MNYKLLEQNIYTLILELGNESEKSKEDMIEVDFKGFCGDIEMVQIDIVDGNRQYLIDKDVWKNGTWVTRDYFINECKKDIDRLQIALKHEDAIDVELRHKTEDEDMISELKEYFTKKLDENFKT